MRIYEYHEPTTLRPSGGQTQALAHSPYAALLGDDDIDAEARKRRKNLVFPLDVFPERIKPLIARLLDDMQGERAFIGLSMLQAAASAIGSSLRASTGSWEVCLSMWGASVGISSSGKTMVQSVLMRPLYQIQDEFNRDYYDRCRQDPNKEHNQKVILYSDITFESLIKDVFQHNYKGVTRYEDELLKWIDDMDRYKSGKSEASFWTSAWSPPNSFTLRRSGGRMVFIEKNHLVASVIGSTQPDVMYRFYEQNRLQTGFIFRMLWAFAETDRVISPNLSFSLPEEVTEPYYQIIRRLYQELEMDYSSSEPQVARLNRGGITLFQDWQDRHTAQINRMDNPTDKNIKAGIFGKIKEYVLRISLVLKAMETAATQPKLRIQVIEDDFVYRALKVCNYFLESGWEAYRTAQQKVLIPFQVLEFAAQLKSHNYNQSRLAETLGMSRQAVNKRVKDWGERYPTAFNAKNQ